MRLASFPTRRTENEHRGGTAAIAPAMLLLGALALLVGTLASCAVVTAPQAPGAMNVSIELQYFQQGNTHVSIGFTDAKLNPVEFVSGETVACDNQFLRYDAAHYVGDVPKQPATGAYTVTYTPAAGATSAAGGVSPISIVAPVISAPVVVTAPQSGATVPIPSTAPLVISYQPSTVDNTKINALIADGRGHFTFTLPEVETGAISASADNFTQFQGGLGTITVSRETINNPGGTPFRSVDVHFKNITQVAIVWQ